jgi:hypothetical protein
MQSCLREILILILLAISYDVSSKELKVDQYKWKNRVLVLSASDLSDLPTKNQLNKFNSTKIENKERKLILIKQKDDEVRFELKLYGLDGGLKKSYSEVTEMKTIYDLIDSMPMRAGESKKPR